MVMMLWWAFFPADHWIADEAAFRQNCSCRRRKWRRARGGGGGGAIATLGIAPTFPSTGYGYIEQGDDAGTYGSLNAYKVTRFTEKPDANTAQTFIDSGKFSWNSGMFIFSGPGHADGTQDPCS